MGSIVLCLLEAAWPRTSYLTFLSLFPHPFNRTNNTYTSQNCCENYILYVRRCSGCFTYTDAHNNPITIPILQMWKLRHGKNEILPVIQLVRATLVAQTVKILPAMQKIWVQSLGQEDALKKGMATHSSILAWRIPWREKPGSLQSMGCKESDMTERLTLLTSRWWDWGTNIGS